MASDSMYSISVGAFKRSHYHESFKTSNSILQASLDLNTKFFKRTLDNFDAV